jgi:checkpoint serine/threonine-protein kinase
MAPAEELVDFSVIETHKENIQSLPGGRSARALAATFSPVASVGSGSGGDTTTMMKSPPPPPTPSNTRDANEAVQRAFEAEVALSATEADDPLDVWDRYVQWALTAYPSAQATRASPLRALLERATRAFLAAPQYRNDARYLRLWLHYIRLFADAPREFFAHLARHGVGAQLALYYEEFAAWLEARGRWAQAREVLRLGVERGARPAERLARKLREFEQRAAAAGSSGEEGPSSPALPPVRPALAAKIDLFATTAAAAAAEPVEPQAAAAAAAAAATAAAAAQQARRRNGGEKLEVFTDADADDGPSAGRTVLLAYDTTKGWETIGSLAQRKKENVVEARPMAGETLKAGGTKAPKAPKMMVFRDEVSEFFFLSTFGISAPFHLLFFHYSACLLPSSLPCLHNHMQFFSACYLIPMFTIIGLILNMRLDRERRELLASFLSQILEFVFGSFFRICNRVPELLHFPRQMLCATTSFLLLLLLSARFLLFLPPLPILFLPPSMCLLARTAAAASAPAEMSGHS